MAAGVVTKARDGVKILGQGELKAKLDLRGRGGVKSAVAAIEKAGGADQAALAVATPEAAGA